ncbi:hypothetical protein ACFQZ4_00105 [Catellatospora coxensis]
MGPARGAIRPGRARSTPPSGTSPSRPACRSTATRLFWHGFLPGTRTDVFFFAAGTPAWNPDIVAQPGVLAEFVAGEDVLSGRAFTPATGFVLARFLESNEYLTLAGRFFPADPV